MTTMCGSPDSVRLAWATFDADALATYSNTAPQWRACRSASNRKRYRPEKLEQARQLVRERFWPVDRVVRPELIVFEFQTGEWHQVGYFPLQEGPGQLAGSDKDAQWMALLSEREGGRENALKLIAEWQAMIANRRTEVVRRPALW